MLKHTPGQLSGFGKGSGRSTQQLFAQWLLFPLLLSQLLLEETPGPLLDVVLRRQHIWTRSAVRHTTLFTAHFSWQLCLYYCACSPAAEFQPLQAQVMCMSDILHQTKSRKTSCQFAVGSLHMFTIRFTQSRSEEGAGLFFRIKWAYPLAICQATADANMSSRETGSWIAWKLLEVAPGDAPGERLLR